MLAQSGGHYGVFEKIRRVRKVDERTFEQTVLLKGLVLTTHRLVVSPDGKTRTTTITGKNAQGQTVNNVLVFERQ